MAPTTVGARINGHLTWADAIKFLLPIVLVIITLAVSWGVLNQRVDRCIADVAETELRLESYKTGLWELKVQLAEIQKDIAYIREKMERNHTDY